MTYIDVDVKTPRFDKGKTKDGSLPSVRTADSTGYTPAEQKLHQRAFERKTFKESDFKSWDWADVFDIEGRMNVSFTTVKRGKIAYCPDRLMPNDIMTVVGTLKIGDVRHAIVRLRDNRYAYIEEVPGNSESYFLWKIGTYKTVWSFIPDKLKMYLNMRRPDTMSELSSIPLAVWRLFVLVWMVVGLMSFCLGALIF